jgi:hypothetical protein
MQAIKVVIDRTFVRGTRTGLSMRERSGLRALPIEHDMASSARSASGKTDIRIPQTIIALCSCDEREDNVIDGVPDESPPKNLSCWLLKRP